MKGNLEGKTILVLDDDEHIMKAFTRGLKMQGATIVGMTKLDAALELVSGHTTHLDAVVTDWDLGRGLNSEPLIKLCQFEEIPVVLVTGNDYPALRRGVTCPILLKGSADATPSALGAFVTGLTTKPA